MQDTNKNKIDHIPLCMMTNLPKVELIQTEGKKYNAREMNMSFQKEDWKAKWFDHYYAEQVNEIDFKEALEQQGDVHFAYGQLEFIMQELATELWPITKEKVDNDSKNYGERCQTLKQTWWTEWTNKRLAAIKESTEIETRIDNKTDLVIFNLFMLSGQPSKKKEEAINSHIFLKDGRAYESQEVVKATFKIWLPLVRYMKYNRMATHEATNRRKKLKKERMGFVLTELETKQKKHEKNMG